MPRFMLDTNSVSYALRGNPPSVREHLRHLAAMDMLVAAHAFASGLTLVTSDRSFRSLRPRLRLADWSKPL